MVVGGGGGGGREKMLATMVDLQQKIKKRTLTKTPLSSPPKNEYQNMNDLKTHICNSLL